MNVTQQQTGESTRFPDLRLTGETPLRQAQLVLLRMLKIFDDICTRHNLPYWLEAGTLLGAIRHKGFIPWDDDIDVSMLRKDYQTFLAIAEQELPDDIFVQTEHTEPGYFNISVPLKLRDKKSLLIEKNETRDPNLHQGIFLDIFPYDSAPDNFSEYRWYKKSTKRFIKTKQVKLLPKSKLSRVPFKYKVRSYYYSLGTLNKKIQSYIDRTYSENSKYVGYGYDFSSPICTFPRDCIFPLKRVRFEDGEFLAPGNHEEFLTIIFGDYMTPPPESERKPKHTQELIPALPTST